MNILGPSLFSIVFIAIGAGILYYARGVAAKAKKSLSWPSIEGVISHSAVLMRTQTSSSGNTLMYQADVAYRYKVKGQDYSSSRITLMDYSSTTGHAQDVVARYPDGSTVAVYYNPADPSDAVLEPGGNTGITIVHLIGWLFAGVGLFFLYMSVTGRVHAGQ
ncbi:MAG: DUF3592 domain-containing protein [Burkholderiaceae bacterium]|nr:DUF3592 domain-containing protein [Burkholderiaceae bacterium]